MEILENGEWVHYEDISDTYKCTKAHKCARDDCFWRLKQEHGFGVWCPPTIKAPWQDHIEKILDGRQIHLPKLTIMTGTNYMGIGCRDFEKFGEVE
jgi:hypothetical protein